MIGWLHPWALAGLLAAGIPILLHLRQQREPPTVPFPAVRYLLEATRRHERRLRLRNLLLLALRVLLVLALVLAAAGPTWPGATAAGHAPGALVIVLDNGATSAAVVGGTPRLAGLRASALAVLRDATPDDALWLLTADGVPRRGRPDELADAVRRLEPSPRRLDLGEAVATARAVLAEADRPGAVLVVSDLHRSALGASSRGAPVIVVRPAGAAPANAGLARVVPEPLVWGPEGGRAIVTLTGDSARAVPVRVALDDRPPRTVVGQPGGTVVQAVGGAAPGWHVLGAALDADEFRLDDTRATAVRVAPLARVDCGAGGRYVVAACDVLAQNGRVARGDEVPIGRLGTSAAIVLPPEDPATVGALNRELERRGVAWRFGALDVTPAVTDSGSLVGRERVLRRYRLERTGADSGGVLATVGRTPWVVSSGPVVLVGSRLEPEWTGLPLSAGFMPFVDALATRIARGTVALLEASPGEPVPLPDAVREVRSARERWTVEGGAPFRAPVPGIYWLLAGSDTVGALSVNVDPRESLLARATDDDLTRLWPGARLVEAGNAARAAFAGAGRGDLRGPLLWLALGCMLGEVALASGLKRGTA